MKAADLIKMCAKVCDSVTPDNPMTASDCADAIRALIPQHGDGVVCEVDVWVQPDHLQKARLAPFMCRVEPTQRFPDFVPLYRAKEAT